jgi:hypothetical protein
MSKAIGFGIAAALVLASAPAWGGDEKATSDTPPSSESKSVVVDENEIPGEIVTASGSAVEAGSSRATPMESDEVRASFEERWLREREGLRDGGY